MRDLIENAYIAIIYGIIIMSFIFGIFFSIYAFVRILL